MTLYQKVFSPYIRGMSEDCLYGRNTCSCKAIELGMTMFKSILAAIGVLIFSCEITSAVLDTTIVFLSCGPAIDLSIPSNQSAFEAILDVKNTLIEETPRNRNFKRYVRFRLPDEDFRSCYGFARCGIYLSGGECRTCLQTADIDVTQVCRFVRRAKIELVDCYMRFSMTHFYEGFRPREWEELASIPDGTEGST